MQCDSQKNRWEASGILAKDGFYFVVFDDRGEIARISKDLKPNASNCLFGKPDSDCGFEGIAYNAAKQRYYLLVEARKQKKDCYQAAVVEYDDKFKFLKQRPLDFAFKSGNKGFEAVAHVRRENKDFVLALCEGNKCQCGAKGRTPGGGRVQLFEKKKKLWAHLDTIELPKSLPFEDYSGMSIDNGRAAIVSQVNSMLWVGEFDESGWTWRNDGQLYEFPRAGNGNIHYGNIEGVAWIAPRRIVTVSDRRSRKNQPAKDLSEKDQSIHIFEIPA
jgi:hypothetical protein